LTPLFHANSGFRPAKKPDSRAKEREVRNYAIVGQTLGVFTEQRARKIPVSDLDVEATIKVNAGRGVEVPLP
jgi:hypothetical protein